jgi:hypothetical protein
LKLVERLLAVKRPYELERGMFAEYEAFKRQRTMIITDQTKERRRKA